MRRAAPRIALACLAFTLLSACDAPAPLTSPVDSDASLFTDEDRELAQRLSISQVKIDENATPLFRALSCDLSIATLQEKGNMMLSPPQRAAVEEIREIYRNRVEDLAEPAGEITAVQRSVENFLPRDADRLRLAVSCLREFG